MYNYSNIDQYTYDEKTPFAQLRIGGELGPQFDSLDGRGQASETQLLPVLKHFPKTLKSSKINIRNLVTSSNFRVVRAI